MHGKGARKVRKQAMKLSLRLALLERRRQLLPRLEPLFNQWKAAHIPMSVRPDDHRHHPHRDRAAPVMGIPTRAILLSARAI